MADYLAQPRALAPPLPVKNGVRREVEIPKIRIRADSAAAQHTTGVAFEAEDGAVASAEFEATRWHVDAIDLQAPDVPEAIVAPTRSQR
ncbi:hypothetical protein [Methylobacterium sp. PvR107]|uniref:hypothetical protein n=1 Tax=Methylobacterium sp. PvR107 TaxID=2806597 RepID=UPI001AEA59C2|nr:hypothetical protein [Methylobacterium sp. PvR107]MBP1180618.1 hypothetical protein [Methylobacterium sp. PvR107]